MSRALSASPTCLINAVHFFSAGRNVFALCNQRDRIFRNVVYRILQQHHSGGESIVNPMYRGVPNFN